MLFSQRVQSYESGFKVADIHKRSFSKTVSPLHERLGDTGCEAVFFDIDHLLEVQFSRSQAPIGVDQTIQPCNEIPLWSSQAGLILKKEVEEWLKVFEVDYYLDIRPYFSNCGSAIVIFNPAKAAIFKLTWL